MFRTLLLTAIITLPNLALGQDMKVEGAAIKIVRKTYGDGFKGLRPFNSQKSGTNLALMATSPGGGIIALNMEKSKLELFNDNKGTSLIVKKRFGNEGFGSFPKISEDGKAAMIEINGSGIPADGASTLKAKGTLRIALATTKKKFKSKPVDLRVGQKFSVAGYDFVVKRTGKPDYGNQPFQASLEVKKSVAAINSFSFEDVSGKPLKTQDGGSSTSGFNGNVTVRKGFLFDKKVSKCVVILEVWTDKKEHDVPFDVTLGIGG